MSLRMVNMSNSNILEQIRQTEYQMKAGWGPTHYVGKKWGNKTYSSK